MVANIVENILIKHLLGSHKKSAFLKLYSLHTKMLFRLAMQLTAGHQPSAERIILDTWAAAIAKLSTFPKKVQLKTWLSSILINCSREHYYKQNFYMLINDDVNEKREYIDYYLNTTQTTMDVGRALRLLPVGYRHVFVLHDINGYCAEDVCKLLHINEGTCNSHLFNARKTLRVLMHGKTLHRGDQYFGWTVDEMNSFRFAFVNVALHDELRERVVNELYSWNLLVLDYTQFSWRKVIAQSL
jgi:RNA polymerase sigma-70 factor (ECF subfamily)